MTPQSTISLFELYMDDTSELSTDEELALFNRCFKQIWLDRPWEFAKKPFTSTTTGDEYISLPSDFAYVVGNNSKDETTNEAQRPVVFVGPTNEPYTIVSWSDRRAYRDVRGYCWVDIVNNRLYFSQTPSAGLTIEFDYVYVPDDYAISDTITLPRAVASSFLKAVFHCMCIDDFIIQQSDKAKSYQSENAALYASSLRLLAYNNSQLIQI